MSQTSVISRMPGHTMRAFRVSEFPEGRRDATVAQGLEQAASATAHEHSGTAAWQPAIFHQEHPAMAQVAGSRAAVLRDSRSQGAANEAHRAIVFSGSRFTGK